MSIWYDPLSYIDIASLYLANPYLWDFALFTMIFVGLAQYVYGKVFAKPNDAFRTNKNRAGKLIGMAIGLALSLSMLLFEVNTGWYIGRAELAILPMIILYVLIFSLLYNLFTEIGGMNNENIPPGYNNEGKLKMNGGNACAAAFAFLLTYPGLNAMFNYPFQGAFEQYALLYLVISIAWLLAVVAAVVCTVRFFALGSGATPAPHQPTPAEIAARRAGTGDEETPSADPIPAIVDSQTPYDQQLSDRIRQFIKLVNQLTTGLQPFKDAGDDLQNAHRDADRAGYTASLKKAVIKKIKSFYHNHLQNNAKHKFDAARKYLESIQGHPHVARIPETLRAEFIESLKNYFTLIKLYDDYNTQMQHNLHAARGAGGTT